MIHLPLLCPLLCLLLAAPPDGERRLQIPGEVASPKGSAYSKIYFPVIERHPDVGNLHLPPLFSPHLIGDFEITTVEAAELLSSADLATRANASAIVQQRAALVEREVVRQLREAAKDPDPAATSRYHTLVAVAKALRVPGAAPILAERTAFAVEWSTLPAGGGVGLDTYFYPTAEALLAIGGRPAADAVLERLSGEWVEAIADRRTARLPPAETYVLTWVLQEVLGRSLAKAAVAARLARSERPDLRLAARLLDQEREVAIDSTRPDQLATQVERLIAADAAAGGEDD